MRFFSLLSLAFCIFGATFALPLFSLSSGSAVDHYQNTPRGYLDADTPLIFRRKTPQRPAGAKVTFNHDPSDPHSAGVTLQHLQLTPKHRKIIEDYHVQLVKSAMKKVPRAKTAEIINLAHSRGSSDPHIHVTAIFRDHRGKVIPGAREGNPNKSNDKRHIYTNPNHKQDGVIVLPKAYRDAVKAHQIRVLGKFDKI